MMVRKAGGAIVGAVMLMVAGCAHGASPAASEATRLDAVMQALPLASSSPAPADAIHNAAVVVEDPAQKLYYAKGIGPAREGGAATITAQDQFPIASVTKTMTATVILQLAEEGKLGPDGIETTLGSLGVFAPAVLDRLMTFEGRNYGAGLTIRQLLAHQSGMRDVFMDDAKFTSDDHQGNAAPESFGGVLLGVLGAHRKCLDTPRCDTTALMTGKTWTPWDASQPNNSEAGILNFYLNHKGGATNGLFVPGQGYHYSDTGYIILGLVIEKLTGDTLHAAYRKRLFDPLGLKHTYLEYATRPATAPHEGHAADFYIGDFPGRTGRFNISFDWAGGGVVSTAEELNRFVRALGEGRLFKKAETLALMTTPQWRQMRGDIAVERGLGVSRLTTPDGISYFGHTGFWGAIMLYEPGTGISLGGTLNQVGHNPAVWAIDLLRAARPRAAAAN
jgi:D-alanyl-D-alanine carboxypeptidase